MKMSDVAKLANVSPATVSRVLRQPDLVSEDTKQKVLQVIEEMNYKPHMIASQFRTKETKIILVVVPDITRPFFSEVLRGIEHTAVENGYQVILGDTENDIEREKEYIDLLYKKQADGAVLLTARMNKESLENLSNQFPIVLACEYVDGLDIPTVSIDNVSSARKVTEHLIKLGHTRIAHITGPMNIILSRDRLGGFQQAMKNHHLKVNQELIQEGGDYSIDSGYDQMMKLLSLEKRPEAVFVFNDEMALGAVKAIQDHGLSVPKDIAVVGFDNLKIASIFHPHITTIDQPKYEIGKKATNLLLTLMKGGTVEKKKFVMKDELIIRESCGANLEKSLNA
ncbi:LacI family DNA-binding transcriptional regulator [Peribacillus sp. ACCC06369]|uniref:LacI family DNA-binding transcriptional regulator n=1 Tax=Peribacillus sp. ACCC06369 TaxID=3055860 RepID=UPI0025A1F4A3|nr:LacI family DNA-binding transcriptional regulator [Peribacillus sp. ACCC06369]MDM5357269.1 LacI family DNA-binding transcriptional regulator [Peribacillus sp. ACCC06369]